MKRLFANALMLVGLTTSSQIMALGLGELTLKSALNQPLVAEIDLVDTAGLSAEEMRPSLATQAAFERAGVDRSYFLTKIRFTTQGNKIVLTTREAVTEPFLNFLVEINWPSGRVLREYTVLLDPPTFDGDTIRPIEFLAADTAPAPVVQPAAPAAEPKLVMPSIVAAKPAAAPVTSAPKATTPVAPVAKPQPPLSPVTIPSSARVSNPAPAPDTRRSENAGSDTYYVQPNDTLWSIALATRPDGSVSPQQMMVAIQRENPEAFVDGNINRLKTRQTLRIPPEAEIRNIARDVAVSEVQRQNSELGRGNAQLDATGRAPSVAAGNRSTSGGEVKLVSANGSEDKANGSSGQIQKGTGNSVRQQALENDLAIALENLDKSRRENQDLAERLKALEEQISTLQRLVSLKDDQLATMQSGAAKPAAAPATAAPATQPAATVAQPAPVANQPAQPAVPGVNPVAQPASEAAPAVAAAGQPTPAEVAPVEAPKPVEPQPAPRPKPVVLPEPAPEPDFIGEMLADPVTLGGLLGVLVLALGGGYVSLRKRRASREAVEDTASAPAAPDLAVAAASAAAVAGAAVASQADDNDDFTFKGDSSGSALDVSGGFLNELDAGGEIASAPSMADILAEADMSIAYGNFDEAIAKLQNAIAAQPDHAEFGIKLLEVYAEADNAEAFADEESRLQAAFGDFYADQIGSLRSRLSNPVDADGGYGDVSLDDLSMEFQSGLDDDLEKVASTTVGEDLQAELDAGLDFGHALDLGHDDHAAKPEELDALTDLDMSELDTLDVEPEEPEESAVDLAMADSLEFDLGAFDEPELADDAADGSDDEIVAENSLDFDLTALDSLQSEVADSEADEMPEHDNLMDFDLSGLESVEPEQEVAVEAAADDSNLMDFDLSGLDSVQAEEPVAEVVDNSNLMEFDLSGLDDLATPEAEAAGEAADDSNLMDFDLSGLELPVTEESAEAETAETVVDEEGLMDFDLSGLDAVGADAGPVEEVASELVTGSSDFDLGELEAELGDLADDMDLADLDGGDDLTGLATGSDELAAPEMLSTEPVADELAAEATDELDLLADLDARLDASDDVGVASLDLSDLENLADMAGDTTAADEFDLADLEFGEDATAADSSDESSADDLAELALDDLPELAASAMETSGEASADDLADLALDDLPELTDTEMADLSLDSLEELSLDAAEELPELSLDSAEELPELSLDAAEELPELSLDSAEELPELSLDSADELPELSLDSADELSLDDLESLDGELADLSLDDLDNGEFEISGGMSDLTFEEASAADEQVFELESADDVPAFDLVDAGDMPDLDFDNNGDLPTLEDLPELGEPVAAAATAAHSDVDVDIDIDALADSEDEFEFLSSTDECATKLDLARVYVEMGDADGARDLLAEIVQEGSDQQKQDARNLLNSIA